MQKKVKDLLKAKKKKKGNKKDDPSDDAGEEEGAGKLVLELNVSLSGDIRIEFVS